MSNSYFQFKQFRIEQSRCAMKVSTDACIQGAWTPILPNTAHILDIGAGTGLLSLMLAQRDANLAIDAIEQDEDAFLQAQGNFDLSPWNNRLQCVRGDVKSYSFSRRYDLIICNPPFFTKSLLGNNDQRNMARHGLSLTLDDLIKVISENLSESGYASILLPTTEYVIWERLLAKNGFFVSYQLNIIPSSGKSANRIVSICTRKAAAAVRENLTIRGDGEDYSAEFNTLMRAFYLNL